VEPDDEVVGTGGDPVAMAAEVDPEDQPEVVDSVVPALHKHMSEGQLLGQLA